MTFTVVTVLLQETLTEARIDDLRRFLRQSSVQVGDEKVADYDPTEHSFDTYLLDTRAIGGSIDGPDDYFQEIHWHAPTDWSQLGVGEEWRAAAKKLFGVEPRDFLYISCVGTGYEDQTVLAEVATAIARNFGGYLLFGINPPYTNHPVRRLHIGVSEDAILQAANAALAALPGRHLNLNGLIISDTQFMRTWTRSPYFQL